MNNKLTIFDTDESNIFRISSISWMNNDFKILSEENKEIDIQEIKELTCYEDDYKTKTINELIKAVKQLNNKINKEKL